MIYNKYYRLPIWQFEAAVLAKQKQGSIGGTITSQTKANSKAKPSKKIKEGWMFMVKSPLTKMCDK